MLTKPTSPTKHRKPATPWKTEVQIHVPKFPRLLLNWVSISTALDASSPPPFPSPLSLSLLLLLPLEPESPSSSTLSLRFWGALPDHSRELCRGKLHPRGTVQFMPPYTALRTIEGKRSRTNVLCFTGWEHPKVPSKAHIPAWDPAPGSWFPTMRGLSPEQSWCLLLLHVEQSKRELLLPTFCWTESQHSRSHWERLAFQPMWAMSAMFAFASTSSHPVV